MVFIIIFLIAFLLQLFLPWYMSLLIAFAACALFAKSAKIAFWQSLLAISILWMGFALFKSFLNDHILAEKVALMIGVNQWWILMILTGVISGLASGISGYSGYMFRKILKN